MAWEMTGHTLLRILPEREAEFEREGTQRVCGS